MDSRGNRDASPRLWRYPRCIPGVYLYIARERAKFIRRILAQGELATCSLPPTLSKVFVFARAEVAVMHPCECRGSHDASPQHRQPRCIPTEWWSRDASLRTRGRASLCRRLGQ